MAITIQNRRDTAANWTSTNPILAQGEIGLELDTEKLKIGDGSTVWNSLDYFGGGITGGITGDPTVDGNIIWHEGNDGIGSGLNADLLDDLDSTKFIRSDEPDTITITDTVADQTVTALTIDHNISGNDTLTADRLHRGLFVEVDSSATGGDISNEHRVFGAEFHADVTGDSDLVYGARGMATAKHTSGTITTMLGLYGLGQGYHTGGTLSSLYGLYGYAVAANEGALSNLFAAYHKAIVLTSATGNVTNAYGTYSEIEIDGNKILGVARAVMAVIDNDGGTIEGAATLFYGDYQGAIPATAYGLWIGDPVINHLGGTLHVEGELSNVSPEITSGVGHILGGIANDNTFRKMGIPVVRDAIGAVMEARYTSSPPYGKLWVILNDGTFVAEFTDLPTAITAINNGGATYDNCSLFIGSGEFTVTAASTLTRPIFCSGQGVQATKISRTGNGTNRTHIVQFYQGSTVQGISFEYQDAGATHNTHCVIMNGSGLISNCYLYMNGGWGISTGGYSCAPLKLLCTDPGTMEYTPNEILVTSTLIKQGMEQNSSYPDAMNSLIECENGASGFKVYLSGVGFIAKNRNHLDIAYTGTTPGNVIVVDDSTSHKQAYYTKTTDFNVGSASWVTVNWNGATTDQFPDNWASLDATDKTIIRVPEDGEYRISMEIQKTSNWRHYQQIDLTTTDGRTETIITGVVVSKFDGNALHQTIEAGLYLRKGDSLQFKVYNVESSTKTVDFAIARFRKINNTRGITQWP